MARTTRSAASSRAPRGTSCEFLPPPSLSSDLAPPRCNPQHQRQLRPAPASAHIRPRQRLPPVCADSACPPARVTRSKKTHVDDTEDVELQLNSQLRQMGLYAADTLGDGNCLFRCVSCLSLRARVACFVQHTNTCCPPRSALSDQLYGVPGWYARLRSQICDYLAANPGQFAGFVDGSYDAYVANMRENGTYGGHVELSAFAKLTLKRIKVIQPKLVLVVTGEEDAVSERARTQKEWERRRALATAEADGTLSQPSTSRAAGDRERRRLRRASQKGAVPIASTLDPPLEAVGPLFIAYHNWEHYSSVRNLDGPHTGLPRIHTTDSASCSPPATTGSDENLEPTEDEKRVQRCLARTHPVRRVRDLLAQHDFNTVVELLTESDANVESDEPVDASSPRSGSGSVSTPATVADEPEDTLVGSHKRLSTADLDDRGNKRRSVSPLTPPPPLSAAGDRPSSAASSSARRTETPDPKPCRRSARLKAAASEGSRPTARERKQLKAVEKALHRKAAAASGLSQEKNPSASEPSSSGPLAVDGFRELKI